MVNNQQFTSDEQINLIFHSFADPTRRKILERLTTEKLTVSEIAKPYAMSLPAISKHLKVLEAAKLIKKEKHGREYSVYLVPQTFKTAAEYIAFYKKFWNTQLDNLEAFLRKEVKDNGRT
jgi:DNA-binding transcriptional ArsR family regulator